MMKFSVLSFALTGLAASAIVGSGAVYAAQPAGNTQATEATPHNWNWEIKDGKRVPKGQRITNPDGSWRETVKQGNCSTVKERSAAGEYKETRSCN